MDNENLYDENEKLQSQTPTPRVQTIQGIQGVDSVEKVSPLSSSTNLNLGMSKQYEWKTKTTPTTKEIEDQARQEGELQFSTGVIRAADSPEAEEFLSTKRLYEKTLGVTEYDELRAKLNLRDDESFTDYYNRTHYIPKGFEVAAKLLLAEEKRKKLYSEVEAGNMSEEDFLYEAYGKDLLKQQGVDFSSSLYWYNKFKQGDYNDPRKNDTFMLQLIDNARTMFMQEKWHEIATTKSVTELSKYVTGQVLDTKTVAELFPEFFSQMADYYDEQEKIIKYYRAGLLSEFNPTIDADGDGKIDFYYSTDGKLYNVNETGQGANTMRAVYNSDGSLNRIVMADTGLGEIAGEFVRGLAHFFTDVIDLVALAGGAIANIFQEDALANVSATMGQFWNSIPVIGNRDYIADTGWTDNDGDVNWMYIGRQASNFIGYIVPTIVLTVATMGGSAGAQAGAEGAKTGIVEGAKVATKEAGKAAAKEVAKTAAKETAKVAAKVTVKSVAQATLNGVKAVGKTMIRTGMSLTRLTSGFSFGLKGTAGIWARRLSGALLAATRESLQTTAQLQARKGQLGLNDGEIVGKALTLGTIDFASGVLLRSVGDQTVLQSYAKLANENLKVGATKFMENQAPTLWSQIALNSFKSSGAKAAVLGANLLLDGMDNIITTGLQASLNSTGDLFNWEAMGNALTNPRFIMSMAYQGYNTAKDMYRVTPEKIAAATTDTIQMDMEFRNFVKSKIAAAEQAGDAAGANALNRMLIDYDTDIQRLMTEVNDTPITYKDEQGNEITVSKKYAELANEYTDKASKANESGKANKESKLTSKANDIIEEGSTTYYTKAEAILKALNNVADKLSIKPESKDNEMSELFRVWGERADGNISRVAIAAQTAIFRQAHQNHLAYIKMANDIFLGGQLAKFLYGKGSKEFQTTIATTIYKTYYNTKNLDQYNIEEQLAADIGEAAGLYTRLVSTLESDGVEEMKNINLAPIVDIQNAVDKDGKPINNDAGAPVYKYIVASEGMTEEGKQKFNEWYNGLTQKEQADNLGGLVLSIPLKGNANDGTDAFQNARQYMKIVSEFWKAIAGDNSPIVEFDEGNYFIKNSTLGMVMKDVSDAGLFIKSLCNLKTALTAKASYDNEAIARSVRTFFAIFGEKEKDFDTAIEDNYNLIPDFINALARPNSNGQLKGAFTQRDLVAIVTALDSYIKDSNIRNNTNIKLPPSIGNGSNYDKVLDLKAFNEDYTSITTLVNEARSKDVTVDAKTVREIEGFLKKYLQPQAQGGKVRSNILDEALTAELISKQDIARLQQTLDFIVGKTSTTLASIRQQRLANSSGTSTESSQQEKSNININDFIDFEEANYFGRSFKRHTATTSKVLFESVNLQDVGTTKDFRSYLASLEIEGDIDTDTKAAHYTKYVEDTIAALQDHYRITGIDEEYKDITTIQQYLYDLENKPDDQSILNNIHSSIEKLDKDYERQVSIALDNAKAIDEASTNLNNETRMVMFNFNQFLSKQGAALQNRLNTNEIAMSALYKADSDEARLAILLGTDEKIRQWNQEQNNLDRFRQQYGQLYQVSVDSEEFDNIMSALGYNGAAYRYTNGEIPIPGLYWNSDTKGVVITADPKVKQEIYNRINIEAYNEKEKAFKRSQVFKDPLVSLKDASEGLTFINNDTKLNPDAIILNTLNSLEKFRTLIADTIEYHEIDVKRGKNAGARFRQLLSAMRGITVETPENEYDYKVLATYKLINSFADLYKDNDSKSLTQPFAVPLAVAKKLAKLGGKNSKLYSITDISNDTSQKLIDINKEIDSATFLDVVTKYITKNGLSSLDEILPINYKNTEELHNNLTSHEQSNLNSAYTPLTWLEDNLSLEIDVYDFAKKYGTSNLNLVKGLDISSKAYDDALNYFKGKSKAEVLSYTEESLAGNIFYNMHKNAYKASSEMNDAYIDAVHKLLPEIDNATELVSFLGNSSFRKNLGQAIRSVLLDEKIRSTIKFEDGFIDINNDSFLNAILDYYNNNYSVVPTSIKQADALDRNLNRVSGMQLQSLNVDTKKLDLDIDTLKNILTISPIEYMDIVPDGSQPIVADKIKAMLLASSMHTDTLNISTQDLYALSPEERKVLLKLIPENDNLKKLIGGLKENGDLDRQGLLDNSNYYNALYSGKAPADRLNLKAIKMPGMSQDRGEFEFISDNGKPHLKKLNTYLNKLIGNAKATHAKDLYFKLSEALNATTENNRNLKELANQLGVYVTPYVNNPGSIQYQNLTIAENLYHRYRNMTDYANALQEFGYKKDVAIKLAEKVYLYSSGMQMQGAHPQFLIFDKSTGNVVDIAMSGSRNDKDDGLIARLYNNYFETTTDQDGVISTHFKKNIINTVAAGETYGNTEENKINPENLVAVRLNRNQLSTTFNDADTDIELYEFKGHEQDFKYMILDKIKAIAAANNLSVQRQDDLAQIQILASRWFHDKEYSTTVGFNRKLIEQGSYLYGKSAQALISTLDQLSVLTDRISRGQNSVNYYTQDNLDSKNQAETDLNDILNLGTTKSEMLDTSGAKEFISDVNQNLRDITLSIADEDTSSKKQLDLFERTREELISDIKAHRLALKHNKHGRDRLTGELNDLQRTLEDVNSTIEDIKYKVQDVYDAMIDAYKSNDPIIEDYINYTNRLVAPKTEGDSFSENTKRNNAINAIKTYLRTTNTAEASALKLTGNDIDLLTSRKFDNYVTIGSKQVKVEPNMFDKNVLGVDIETFYNRKTGKQHVFEITLHYIDQEGNKRSVTKYIQDPDVQDWATLKEKYPDYYNEYYMDSKKGPGSKKAFDNYLKNKDVSKAFDKILEDASNSNAILFGYNSKQYDLKLLQESGILDSNNPMHQKLLANHIDVFDVVKTLKTSDNIDLHGGRATLEAVAEQLGIKIKNAHLSSSDIQGTLDVLKAIISNSITTYSSDTVEDIYNIYKAITGKQDIAEEDHKYIRDALINSSIDYDSNKDSYSEELGGLTTHLKNILTNTEHFNKTANLMQTVVERETNKRVDTIIRYINNQINLNVEKKYQDFADAFSMPKVKNDLIDIVAYKLQDIDNKNDIENQLQLIANTLSPNAGETTLINSLINNKNILHDQLGIDMEQFKTWKQTTPNIHKILSKKLSDTYGPNLSSSVNEDNTKISLSYSLQPISNYVDSLGFLSNEDSQLIKQLSSNLFNYKGEWKPMSAEEPKLDLFSNYHKDLMTYYMTDPVISQGAEGIYRLAQTSLNSVKIKNQQMPEYLKNRTLYMTETDYKELMGYEDSMDIGDIKDVYLPVIRYPADKLDSLHGFKIKILDDNESINSGINLTSLLALLNGDADGDKLKILRPDAALSTYLKQLDDAGKYSVYDTLDTVMDKAYKYSSTTDLKTEIDNKELLKINTDQTIAERELKDLAKLLDGKATYKDLKQQFINDFKDSYSEKILDKMYIQEGIDVSDKILGHKAIYYSNLTSLSQDATNTTLKRAYTIAQMAEYGILRYADTQTGMFQKGLLTEDYTKYGDISLVDNIIRLDPSTKMILDLVPDLKNILPEEITNDSRFTKLLDKDIPNSIKLETILRVQQYEKLNSKEYKHAVAEAIKSLKNTKSPFVDAYKAYVGKDSEGIFFKDLDTIIALKGQTKNQFSFAKSKRLTQNLKHLTGTYTEDIEDNKYKPGVEVNIIYDLKEEKKLPADTVQYVGWDKDKKHYGANAIKKVNAKNSKELSNKTVNHFAVYNKLQSMSKHDVELVGGNYNKNCKYFYVATNNNIITYITSFNMDVAKTMTEANAASKATPTSSIKDLSEIKNDAMRNLIEANNVVQIRSFKQTFEPKKTDRDYNVFTANSNNYKLYDENGNEVSSVDDARYVITKENILPLEASVEWNQRTKQAMPFEESAIGNNMLGTGGIGVTHGVFVDSDALGNDEIKIDNTRYSEIKNAIYNLSQSNRYAADGTDLFEHLAVATIIKHIDSSEIERDRTKYYQKIMRGNAQEFINSHRKIINEKGLTPFERKLLSQELYRKVYVPESVVNTDSEYINNSSAHGLIANALFYKPKTNIKGNLKDMYNLRENPNITTIDLLNELNAGHSYISHKTAQDAELNGLLLNRQLSDKPVDYTQWSNNQYKRSQIFTGPIENNPSELGVLQDIDDPRYYTNYNFKGMNPVTKLSKAYEFDNNISRSIKGKRFASLVNSLIGTENTYKSRDTILQQLSPNLSGLMSMAVPTLQYDSTKPGHVHYIDKGVSLGPNGYADVSMAEARNIAYNQQRSPYYWDSNNVFNSNHSELMESILSMQDSRKLANDETLASSPEFNKMIQELSPSDPNGYKQRLLEQASEYNKKLREIGVSEEAQKFLTPTSYQGEIISGNKVGQVRFKERRFGLNNGLALDSIEALEQDRNIHQIRADSDYTAQKYTSQLAVINSLVERDNCAGEFNLFAYVTALQSKLDTVDATDKIRGSATIDDIKARLEEVGVTDARGFIDSFTKQHYTIANRFYSLIKDLDNMASRYSQVTNEPGKNIYFLLTPKIANNSKAGKEKTKYVTRMLQQSYLDETPTPIYDSYDVINSLQTTIQGVANRAAIYNNAQRLKDQGMLDSYRIQNIIMETFSGEEVRNQIRASQSRGKYSEIDEKNTLALVASRIQEKINDSELNVRMENLLNKVYPGSSHGRQIEMSISMGEAYLEMLDILSSHASSFKINLDEALEMANANNNTDFDNIIYVYRQMQDVVCRLMDFCPEIKTSLFTKLSKYAQDNNLSFVDKYGRMFDRDSVYSLTETSLEFVPRILSKYKMDYETDIITSALTGNLFYMDSTLAKVFADKVFVKRPLKNYQKVLNSTARWGVKMIMSLPLKMIDRVAKFTMFDAATLNTANAKTFFNQPQAYKDLRAYFSSKGGYASPDLDEFLQTQGIRLNGQAFDGLITGDGESNNGGIFKAYTDAAGNNFTFQSLSQRYAYWLATKKSIEKGDYSVLGSAYHLRNYMEGSSMTAGEQAAFAMAQNIGAINDFPSISKDFSRYGFVFTTFPMAAIRWGVGELRSAGAAIQDIFTEGLKGPGAKWIARNAVGLAATYALEQLLINVICDMYGVDKEDENRKKWKQVGALPNITQTLVQGQPIMDTYATMNVPRAVLDIFLNTQDTSTESEDNNAMTGLKRFILKNIVGHANPLLKNAGELAFKKDLIDDQIIDTSNKYNAMENILRKASSYFLGGAGANAAIQAFQDNSGNFADNIATAAKRAVNAELGNTKAVKENKKNYYKAIGLLNEYIYADNDSNSNIARDIEFNQQNYSVVKTKLYSLINKEANASEVYNVIQELIQNGYSKQEIKAALKNVSVSGKLAKLASYDDFISSLTSSELQNIKTALAYEQYMFPWLEDNYNRLTSEMKDLNQRNKTVYTPSFYTVNYNYNKYQPQSYTISNSLYNYKNNRADAFEKYNEDQQQQAYNKRQAEYKRNQRKYGGN